MNLELNCYVPRIKFKAFAPIFDTTLFSNCFANLLKKKKESNCEKLASIMDVIISQTTSPIWSQNPGA